MKIVSVTDSLIQYEWKHLHKKSVIAILKN